jgi:lysine decarboxylase
VTGLFDHERAPIFDTLAEYARSGIYGFHTPGHKGGRFAAAELTELVGKSGLALDLPAMTATDNTFHPTGCIRDAQQLAADLFGAEATFFLSAGSTLGVAAALLATVPHGQTVALPRNVHRSVVAGLVLSGALPRFISHDVLPECGALGVSPTALAAALDTDPRPAAVLLTRPSYYGLTRELGDLVAVCRQQQVPLIVDEAHGAHLHFLPSGHPQPALACGADLVVQSCHKTLGSLLGSAQLHAGRESQVDPARVQDALNLLQTTSPSFLLLASLDVMRRCLWRDGRELFGVAVDEARRLENDIDMLPGLRVLRPETDARLVNHHRDPLRLVVNVTGTGWSGYEVERYLRTEFRVEDEMADWFNVVYVLSPHDDPAARQRLLAGLRAVSERGAGSKERRAKSQEQGASGWNSMLLAPSSMLLQPPIPPLAMSPRKAALSDKSAVSLATAAGRTCAEMVMFYPPGIPLLMPGELVTAETIDVCRQLLTAGAHPYASDPALETIRVVD